LAKRSKYDELKPFNRHDKDKVHTSWWSDMPRAAKRVYLLVHRHADQYGESYPKVETMAEEAGVDAKTISRGLKDLEKYTEEFEFWVVKKEPKKQKYKYRIQQLPRDHPNTIRLYPELIDEGHFKKLSLSAISVYFAMRGLVSKVEKEANWVKVKGEGIETYKVPYAEVEATNSKIAQAAGVDRRNMKEILRELMHALLIKPVEWDQEKMKVKGKKWVVYVLPVYSLALKDEERGTYEVKNAEALDEICRFLSSEKSDFVPEDVGICRGKKSKKKSKKKSNILYSRKCGSTEIARSGSSPYPGNPEPLRSPKTPVRGKLANHITTDWNKRDCQQCMYRDNDDDTEYCARASSEQENTIGKMEYCPMDD
jgi:DNA-binding transcriptional regulator YhcF (GntR family)